MNPFPSANPTDPKPFIVPLKPIHPETARQRTCFFCAKVVGGGQGAWKRCSACLGVCYCSTSCQTCQKAHWKQHKAPCRATVAEREQKAALRKAFPFLPPPHEDATICEAYMDAHHHIARTPTQIAARSALQLNEKDSLVFTHILELTFEWQGRPAKIDYQDRAAVIKQFRLTKARVVDPSSDPEMLTHFKSILAQYRDRHVFIMATQVRDRKGARVLELDSMAEEIYPVYAYHFRNCFGRHLKVNPNWEMMLEKTRGLGADFWRSDTADDSLRDADVTDTEGRSVFLEYFEYLKKNWGELYKIVSWPPRED